jgi:hypothetical protein
VLIVIAATPVPVSATAWGLLVELSAMVNVPDRAAVAEGVNTTAMLQVLAGVKLEPHVFVCEKSPEAAIPEIVSVALPEFVNTIV